MRIATWNVNGLRARLDFVAHWLKARQPNVVGLQELKLQDAEFPHEFFNDLGYSALVHGQKSWNGVAILTNGHAELTQTGLPGQDERGSRLISADIEGGINFTTVYCPNGKTLEHADYPGKLHWYDSLLDHWQAAEHDARVLCGDFNIVPEAQDTWRGDAALGDIFHTDAERQRLQAIKNTGLVDLFREKYPSEQQFSWWDYRGGAFHRKQGLRIDFLLAAPSVANQVSDVVIDRDYRKKQDGLTASDHAPVFVDLAV
jgi:exodeoxyribonuclease-3